MSGLAVEAEGVSKRFRIYQEKYTSLKERLIHLGRVPYEDFKALDDVSRIHPQIREEFETGASHMWHDDPYAGGAFALFLVALVVNGNLTGVLSLAAGTVVLLLALFGRRAILPLLGALAVLGLAASLYQPLATRARPERPNHAAAPAEARERFRRCNQCGPAFNCASWPFQ